MSALAVGLVFPLIALIGVHVVQMEGRTPLLTFLQLVGDKVTLDIDVSAIKRSG